MKQSYPVVRRRPSGPSPDFFDWVAQFGVARLARSLGVTAKTVHAWVTPVGERSKPRTEYVLGIVALSTVEPLRGRVRLTPSDILGEVRVEHMEVRQ